MGFKVPRCGPVVVLPTFARDQRPSTSRVQLAAPIEISGKRRFSVNDTAEELAYASSFLSVEYLAALRPVRKSFE